MHCPGGNATNPIWRVLASSQGISSWTPLKPQHSIPHWLSVQWEPSSCRSCQCCQKKGSSKVCGWICSVWPSWVWESQHASTGNSVSWSLAHSSRFSFHCMAFFLSLKQNFIAYCSSSRPDCIFEIHQLWQSGFSRVYSNCCCSYSFEPEIIKIGQSSHKMYNNNILNFQESTTILNACTKKSGSILKAPRVYIYIYIKFATLVEGDPKAPFSIATTLRCRVGCYSIPMSSTMAPLYPWSSPYNAESKARWHQVPFFESLVWLDLGLNPSLPDHWWILYSLGPIYIYIYIYIKY